MGGGNGQKSATKRERNAAKLAAPKGTCSSIQRPSGSVLQAKCSNSCCMLQYQLISQAAPCSCKEQQHWDLARKPLRFLRVTRVMRVSDLLHNELCMPAAAVLSLCNTCGCFAAGVGCT